MPFHRALPRGWGYTGPVGASAPDRRDEGGRRGLAARAWLGPVRAGVPRQRHQAAAGSNDADASRHCCLTTFPVHAANRAILPRSMAWPQQGTHHMPGLDKGPILVTGASGGIGAATVRQLRARAPRSSRAAATASSSTSSPPRPAAARLPFDLTSEESSATPSKGSISGAWSIAGASAARSRRRWTPTSPSSTRSSRSTRAARCWSPNMPRSR